MAPRASQRMSSSRAVPITDPIQQGEGRTISLGVSVEAVEQFQVETSGTGVEFNGQGSENYTIKSGTSQISRLRVRVPAKYRPRRQGLLSGRSSGRASKRIWCHHRRPDHQEKGFLLFLLRRVALSSYQPHAVCVHADAERAAGRFQRIARGDLRPADDGRRSRRLLPHAVPGKHHSCQPHFGNLEGLSIALAARRPTPALQNNYLGSVPVSYNNDSFNAKVDYNLTTNQRLSGLYTHGKRSQPGPYREISTGIPQTVLPLPYTDTRLVTEIPTVLQVKHSWTISPNLVNQAQLRLQPLLRSHHKRHLRR